MHHDFIRSFIIPLNFPILLLFLLLWSHFVIIDTLSDFLIVYFLIKKIFLFIYSFDSLKLYFVTRDILGAVV